MGNFIKAMALAAAVIYIASQHATILELSARVGVMEEQVRALSYPDIRIDPAMIKSHKYFTGGAYG